MVVVAIGGLILTLRAYGRGADDAASTIFGVTVGVMLFVFGVNTCRV
jgi:hypothetical protein